MVMACRAPSMSLTQRLTALHDAWHQLVWKNHVSRFAIRDGGVADDPVADFQRARSAPALGRLHRHGSAVARGVESMNTISVQVSLYPFGNPT